MEIWGVCCLFVNVKFIKDDDVFCDGLVCKVENVDIEW